MNFETWEWLSYVVTVVGLPLPIAVFLLEQRKERRNEEDAVYESVSDNYQEFLRIVLELAGEDPEIPAYIRGLASKA